MNKTLPDLKEGDRVKLIKMDNDPHPIPIGTVGTVTSAQDIRTAGEDWTQVAVSWDNGRSLSCVCPPDIVQKI